MGKGQWPADLEFSFSASGWLMMYQLGVAFSLQRCGVDDTKGRFIGASGGAACSAALALNVDAKLLGDFMVRCCADYHKKPLKNMWKMRQYAEACVRRCMHEGAHEYLNDGRLNVQVTILPSCKGRVISKFHSAEYYCKSVLASCTMSPVAGMPFKLESEEPDLNGKYVMDGGVSQLQPVLSEKTFTVCPLYFMDADIKPSRYVPIHWAVFPPSVKEFRELFWLGARDGLEWLKKKGFGEFHPVCVDVIRLERFTCSEEFIRIKPLQTQQVVTLHSSFDASSSALNPNSFSSNFAKRIRGESISTIGSSSSGFTEDEEMDSFEASAIDFAIRNETLLAGEPMSFPLEQVHRVGDSIAMVTAATAVKPLAVGIVYAELWSKAAMSAANAAFQTIEKSRRDRMKSRGGWVSMRRWIHDEMVGSASESWSSALEVARIASDPSGLLSHVPLLGEKLVHETKKLEAKAKLSQHSRSYRLLSKAALI